MKTSRFPIFLAAALTAFFLAGCATPASRIQANLGLFAGYSPQQQELIKQGKIAVGFDMGAVRLALGEPDRVHMRTNSEGSTQTWTYVTYETYSGMPLYRGWYHRYYGWGNPYYPWFEDYPVSVESAHLRVIFDRAGHVSSIEQRV